MSVIDGSMQIPVAGAVLGRPWQYPSTREAPPRRWRLLRNGPVQAVVSRGGGPDLAGDYLHAVRQPMLLIVGGNDTAVIELNRQAMEQAAVVKDHGGTGGP